MTLSLSLVLLLEAVLATTSLDGNSEPPPELLNAFEALSFLRVDVTREVHLQGNEPVHRIRTRITENERIEERDWLRPTAVLPEERKHGARHLWASDRFYTNMATSLLGTVHEAAPPHQFADPFDKCWGGKFVRGLKFDNYNKTMQDSLLIITGQGQNGAQFYQATWIIDPEKGYVVKQFELARGDKLVARVLTDYEEVDGRYLPKEMAEFNGHNLNEPIALVKYSNAVIRSDLLPGKLTPADIGIECGTRINLFPKDGPPQSGLMWDGEKIGTVHDVTTRIKRGELKTGATVEAELCLARLRVSAPHQDDSARSFGQNITDVSLRHRPGLWREYVQYFIEHHELNREQSERAWVIHKDCVEIAERHISRRREQFNRVALELDDPDRAVQAAERESELLKPLRAIFDDRLRPRLHSLLTRHQARAGIAG